MTKLCLKCKADKPFAEFNKHRGRRDGYQDHCKPCHTAGVVDWCKRNPEYHWSRNLKVSYGITGDEYNALLLEQGNICKICKGVNPGDKRLAVDHDHACCPGKKSCGKCIRGLLCDLCNRGLGYFRDDPILLDEAKRYLAQEAEDDSGSG